MCKTATPKKDKTKILMTNGSLMKVERIAECSLPLEHSAILLTCMTHYAIFGLTNQFSVVFRVAVLLEFYYSLMQSDLAAKIAIMVPYSMP